MDFRDALKFLRSELGVTQTELAGLLHVSVSTVSRWELGRTCPNRSVTALMLDYAAKKGVSQKCIYELQQSLTTEKKKKLDLVSGRLNSVEHASLSQLIDDAVFPLYVSDIETDELLYINRRTEELLGGSLNELPSNKCYVCLMRQETRCEFCHREDLCEDRYICFDVVRPFDNIMYRVYGKKIQWNGRRAQVHYIVLDAGRPAAE